MMRQRIYQVIHKRASALLGSYCAYCAMPCRDPLCDSCLDLLEYPKLMCSRCATQLEAPSTGNLCRNCIDSPPYFDYTKTLYIYEGVLADLIVRAKTSRDVSAIAALVYLLKQQIEMVDSFKGQFILAMPTPRSRLMARGFNLSSLLLSRAKICEKIISPSAVSLPFYVKKQTQLDLKSRKNNPHQYKIKGRLPDHVIIFDDVLTTGSTASELAKRLKQHGVKSVGVWVISRAILK